MFFVLVCFSWRFGGEKLSLVYILMWGFKTKVSPVCGFDFICVIKMHRKIFLFNI